LALGIVKCEEHVGHAHREDKAGPTQESKTANLAEYRARKRGVA
jgi:hypothetical protein